MQGSPIFMSVQLSHLVCGQANLILRLPNRIDIKGRDAGMLNCGKGNNISFIIAPPESRVVTYRVYSTKRLDA